MWHVEQYERMYVGEFAQVPQAAHAQAVGEVEHPELQELVEHDAQEYVVAAVRRLGDGAQHQVLEVGRFFADPHGQVVQRQRTIGQLVVGGDLHVGADGQRPQVDGVLEYVYVRLVREILAVGQRQLVQVVPQQVLEPVVRDARVADVHRPQVGVGHVLEQMGETVEYLAAVVLVRLDERLAYLAGQRQPFVQRVTLGRFRAQRFQVPGHVLEAQTEQRLRYPFLFVPELDRYPLPVGLVHGDGGGGDGHVTRGRDDDGWLRVGGRHRCGRLGKRCDCRVSPVLPPPPSPPPPTSAGKPRSVVVRRGGQTSRWRWRTVGNARRTRTTVVWGVGKTRTGKMAFTRKPSEQTERRVRENGNCDDRDDDDDDVDGRARVQRSFRVERKSLQNATK